MGWASHVILEIQQHIILQNKTGSEKTMLTMLCLLLWQHFGNQLHPIMTLQLLKCGKTQGNILKTTVCAYLLGMQKCCLLTMNLTSNSLTSESNDLETCWTQPHSGSWSHCKAIGLCWNLTPKPVLDVTLALALQDIVQSHCAFWFCHWNDHCCHDSWLWLGL
jgi:hypothetical protein